MQRRESMTNAKKFEIALLQKGKSKKDIAQLLGVSMQTIYNKVNNVVDFKAQEVRAICDYLELTTEEMIEIFFAENVD
jgi:DNA-binding Xre family transcriptional regulator